LLSATRFVIVAAAAAATLPISACGSSDNGAPSQSTGSSTNAASAPSPAPPAPAPAPTQAPSQVPAPVKQQRVAGLIATVAGNTVRVTLSNGTVSVDFTPSTKITELGPAALSDVTTGSCVVVRPDRDNPTSGGMIVAGLVWISPAIDGSCPQQEPPHGGVSGRVASVSGNDITINGASRTTVMVGENTHFSKEVATTSRAIAAGKCISATGNGPDGGPLQATRISLRPTDEGRCPGAGSPHHGHGG
jgi:Domain of unknown function (DUF5666)